MKKHYKVLLVFDTPFSVTRDHDFGENFRDPDWKTENDIFHAIGENGYQVRLLGIHNDVSPLLEEIRENKPDIIFNLLEVFRQRAYLEKNFASFLELLEIPYTGSSPAALFACNNKALTKKVLSYHKIRVPHFHTFYRRHRVWLPKRLRLPLIVKPLREEASRGISLGSVVDDEKSMIERVAFLHENMGMDAIVEEYIEGRELYVSVIGNKKVRVFPLREMIFGTVPEDEPRIATYKAKWNEAYRKKWGMKNVFAGYLPGKSEQKIMDICKRAYKALNMRSYARFDIRLTPDGKVFIFEANANPNLARDDELAKSAEKAGLSYAKLIHLIISLAFKRK